MPTYFLDEETVGVLTDIPSYFAFQYFIRLKANAFAVAEC